MATHTELSAHPSKMGVTAAARGDELEHDLQRKMKLWGVIKAFNDGRMPDNRQIDQTLEYAIANSPVDLKKLSPEGRALIDDTRDILETLRMMVREKNADELFQNAVWSSYAGDPTRAKQSGVAPVSRAEANKDVDQAAAHMRVLVTLFITNSEFRKIINDLGFVGRDVFATAASKAADKARPSQQQLDQVDQEAPSKQWIDPDGQRLGTHDTPEVALKGPDGSQVRYNPKDAPGNAEVRDSQGNSRSAGQAYNEAQQRKEEAREQKNENKGAMKDQIKSHAQDLNNSRDPNASLTQQKDQLRGAAQGKRDQAQHEADRNGANVDRDQAQGQAREKANQMKERIPERQRAAASDAINSSRQIVDDAFPEERREQFIYRLKKVVVECQEHKDYMEAMTWLLDTLENYQGHAKHVAHKGTNAAQEFKSDRGIADATWQFRHLLERFANGKSMDGITDAMDQIYTDSQNDPELRKWWSHVNDYVHRALLETGWILEDECESEGNEIIESGKYFFTDKYKRHQQRLADEIQLWATALADDPLNQRLGEDVKRLTKDILFNEEGNLTFKPHLWNDIRLHFLPEIIKRVGYFPIPRAEYSDDKIDLVIENLILSGPNLFPNVIELMAHNHFVFSPYEQVNRGLESGSHAFKIGFSQIQCDIKDVLFSFRRKSGWPKLSDSGIADVVIAGKGISISVEIEAVQHRRDRVFRTKDVTVELDTLTFKIRDSKHDLLYKFVKSVATGVIKKAIIAGFSAGIRAGLSEVHDQLLQVRNTMDDAKKADDTTRRDSLKQLYSRKAEKSKQNKEAAKQHTGEFKLVTERDDMLNPDMLANSKKSVSGRLFKTEDFASSGQSWHSPAFDLHNSTSHPAATGELPRGVVPGAGHKNANTSAVEAARGHTTQAVDATRGHTGHGTGYGGIDPTRAHNTAPIDPTRAHNTGVVDPSRGHTTHSRV